MSNNEFRRKESLQAPPSASAFALRATTRQDVPTGRASFFFRQNNIRCWIRLRRIWCSSVSFPIRLDACGQRRRKYPIAHHH